MKYLFLLLLLFSLNTYSEESYSVNTIGNSCAPFDGHAIYFSFKNNNNPGESINIQIWRWRTFLPSLQTTFDFNSKSSKNGSMNICKIDNSKPSCKLLSGSLHLDRPFYSFKTGDKVSGYIVINSFNYKKINFIYEIKKEQKSQIICG